MSTLYAIAAESGLSVDWLLFGSGSPMRERGAATSEGKVVASLVAVLEAEHRRNIDATQEELKEVWDRLRIYRSQELGYPSPFLTAVEGLRPLYDELLRHVRWGNNLLVESSRMAMQVFKRQRWSREQAAGVLSDFAREVAQHIVQREEVRGIRRVIEEPSITAAD